MRVWEDYKVAKKSVSELHIPAYTFDTIGKLSPLRRKAAVSAWNRLEAAESALDDWFQEEPVRQRQLREDMAASTLAFMKSLAKEEVV